MSDEEFRSARRGFLKKAIAGLGGITAAFETSKEAASTIDAHQQAGIDDNASAQALRNTIDLYRKQNVPEGLVADIIRSYEGHYEEISGRLKSTPANNTIRSIVPPASGVLLGGLTGLGIVKAGEAVTSFADKLATEEKDAGKSTQQRLT